MDMPEGFIRLEKRIMTEGLTLQNADRRYYLDLIKEMAEVIEYAIGPTRDVKIPRLKAILDKFKDWK